MNFPERLELVMKSQLLDVMQLAHLLGVNERNIRNYLSGQTMPKIEFAESIYRRLPQISAHWLLTGEGVMLAAPVNGPVQVVQGNGHVGQVTQQVGADPCAGDKAKVAELEKEVAYLQKINALLEAAKNNRINAMKTLSYQNHKPSSTPKPQGALLHQLLRLTRSLTRMRRKVYMTPSEQDEAMLHEMEKARLDPRKTSLEDGLRIIQAQIDAHRPRA